MVYDGTNLEEVLKEHALWVKGLGYDLRYRPADFSNQNLRDVDMSGHNLAYAIFKNSDLSGANFNSADLNRADFTGANLCLANFYGANLHEACFREAILRKANLNKADLHDAFFADAYLFGSSIYNAKNVPDNIPMICPSEGSFIGWKQCFGVTRPLPLGEKLPPDFVIVKLLIPEDAKRCSGPGRKCRCDKAIVLEIQNMDGTRTDYEEASSRMDVDFIYRIGETVTPTEPFNENRWVECTSGIHFFIDRSEAVEY